MTLFLRVPTYKRISLLGVIERYEEDIDCNQYNRKRRIGKEVEETSCIIAYITKETTTNSIRYKSQKYLQYQSIKIIS